MRPALLVPFALAGIIAAPLTRTSEACMCMPAALNDLYTSSSDVVAGRVVGVHRTGADAVVRIEVDRVYKGTATPGAVLTISLYDGFLGDHQTPGRLGQRWMVFAYPHAWPPGRREPRRRYPPSLRTGSCAGNWRITAKHPAPEAFTFHLPSPSSLPSPALPPPTWP